MDIPLPPDVVEVLHLREVLRVPAPNAPSTSRYDKVADTAAVARTMDLSYSKSDIEGMAGAAFGCETARSSSVVE